MNLNWQSHPQQANKRTAVSASHQYVLIVGSDGTTGLTVQHRGDRPSARPVKSFTYKSRKAAENGAQRFEDRHGYEDPGHHAPLAVVPFLRPFPKAVTNLVGVAESALRTAERSFELSETAGAEAWRDERLDEYKELCASLLCCEEFECYERTEVSDTWCGQHRAEYGITED